MRQHRSPGQFPDRSAFSLIELLLVAALGAVIFSAGALAFRVVAGHQRTPGSWQTVFPPQAVVQNFFGASDPHAKYEAPYIDSYVAPNFGRCSLADTMRTRFLEDTEKSVAVFVLPRVGNINTIRPARLELRGVLPQAIDTPEAFRTFLTNNSDTSAGAGVFIPYRGAPSATGTYTTMVGTTSTAITGPVCNATVFLLQASGSNTQLWIRAVYEIDYVSLPKSATDPLAPDVDCVLGSVRRYVSGALTHYYDVVYRGAATSQAGPACAHFERGSRAAYSEASAIQKFKIAGNQPFYLIWWPDPGVASLAGTTSGTYTSTQPQSAYALHEGQTSYMFVVPQFPAL